MRDRVCLGILAILCAPCVFAASEAADTKTIPLTISAGAPLRMYLTSRLTKRVGAPAHARLIEPLFAFDREVVPAGAEVVGHVSRLIPVSKMTRTRAILGGDFTPLRQARVEFTAILLPDGRQITLNTVETPGLDTIYAPPKKPKSKKNGAKPKTGGVLGTGKQEAQNRINDAISGRTSGVAGIVRGPDKKEHLQEFLMSKLPYHPQWIIKGTRFDAELRQPLGFGSAIVKADALQLLGTQPPADSTVHTRLITPLNSGTAARGDRVEAIVTQPLFSPDHKLILPEGAHLTGAVTFVHSARWFHRGGRLRFNFQQTELPPGFERPALAGQPQPRATKTLATLKDAESSTRTAIKVDDEGGVKATEPKTRLIGPVVAVLIASRASDSGDAERRHGTTDSNVGGRTRGGISGFGLAGAAAAQASRTLGSALGFYGMAWSVYSGVVARGGEVEFKNDAAMDIRFGARTPIASKKYTRQQSTTAGAGGL